MIGAQAAISFAPVVPVAVLLAACVGLAAMLGFAFMRSARGGILRGLAFGVILLALAGPRYQQEVREPQRDVAVIVLDRSASQDIEGRRAQSDAALRVLSDSLGADDTLDLRIVESHGDDNASMGEMPGDTGTRLMTALVRAAGGIPRNRYAGGILITDGQVHDMDDEAALAGLPEGPLHVLLSGERDAFDRRLIIEQVPGYGLVGKASELIFRVEQTAGHGRSPIPVTLSVDGIKRETMTVQPGDSTAVNVTLDHAGASVVELRAASVEGELSGVNNVGVASINAVRDRLRVLLVSGKPHAGERTWRNLLKSDPSVDLVHFTILRPPNKSDFTPIDELSLITFPTFELFDLKINEFDLIVFDRYTVRHVLSAMYFHNIRNYVEQGGALMLAVGPEYAGRRSLYETPLGSILPARPSGEVIEQAFLPRLSDNGRRHPVSAGLSKSGAGDEMGEDVRDPTWGRWMRQVDTSLSSGTVLMEGQGGRPLLVLDRKGEGRVAVLTSDHLWLWARGYEGGGPQAELVRRLAHWLMKEPTLEEERLSAERQGDQLIITRRSLSNVAPVVRVTPPGAVGDVQSQTLALEASAPGEAVGRFPVHMPGVYRVEDGALSAFAVVGSLNPLEYRDLRATPAMLQPLVAQSHGGLWWLRDGMPDVRRVRPGRDTAGDHWLGLRANEAYVVTGLAEVALLPGWLAATLAFGFLFAAWRREGS